MLINIVCYVSTMVLSNNNMFKYVFSLILFNKFDIFYNKLIDTDLRLVDESCDVIS